MDEEKKKFQGDWKCSGCGAPITELPFQPDPAREGELTCFDCLKQKTFLKKCLAWKCFLIKVNIMNYHY